MRVRRDVFAETVRFSPRCAPAIDTVSSLSMFDLIIIGAGPAGLTAAIVAGRARARVLVLESGPRIGRKLLASGGGRCNLTNTLPADEFVARFGRQGRFMLPSLEELGSAALRDFLAELGVPTHAPDGRRVFPVDHRSRSVLDALVSEVVRLGVEVRTGYRATDVLVAEGTVTGVRAGDEDLPSQAVLLATGGCGYPALGGDRSGQELAARCGHGLASSHPGMVPLVVRESWPGRCRRHTVGGAVVRVRRPGKRRIEGRGDLIFTRVGLAGPVILDLAREITPLLETADEIPLELELTGRSTDDWRAALTGARQNRCRTAIRDWLHREGGVGASLAIALPEQAEVPPDRPVIDLSNRAISALSEVLARVTLTVTGHAGWSAAMVMRGGVRLKDVRPETLESRRVSGLFLAGEVLDLDGPCGGFNLQWAFASGHRAGSAAVARIREG